MPSVSSPGLHADIWRLGNARSVVHIDYSALAERRTLVIFVGQYGEGVCLVPLAHLSITSKNGTHCSAAPVGTERTTQQCDSPSTDSS